MPKTSLHDYATKKRSPDGDDYLSLSLAATQQFAKDEGISLNKAEIHALDQGIIPEHYQRNIGSIGIAEQKKLLQSHVGIAGAGGLGGVLIEILARHGVGTLTIADFDTFEESNLNRQLLANEETLGTDKVSAAKRRVARINPAVQITAVKDRLTDHNAGAHFQGVNVIADALGNVVDRFIVQEAARTLSVPLVHAAIAGTNGQLCTVYPEDRGLEAIYGPRTAVPQHGDEAGTGTPPTTVFAVASLQALEIVRILTGTGATMRNALAVIDLATLSIDTVRIPR